MLGHASIKHLIRLIMLFAAMLWGADNLSAARFTQIVDFATTQTSGANQLAINGTLDTLAQGLREVNFGATTVGTQGTLRAELTYETSPQQDPVLLGVKFLQNSFEQSAVSLFYDVPGTTRRVSFSANNLKFSLDLDDIPVTQPPVNLLSANLVVASGALSMNPNAYQMVQNQGMAEIAITNRPPKQQNLFEQQITSAYVPPSQPSPLVDTASLVLSPPTDGSSNYIAGISLPLVYQQLHYGGVGLPVTLAYSGNLQLTGLVPIMNATIPEPSAILLASGSAIGILLRRRHSQF